MFQRILLCADGSENALRAARSAAEIAKKFDSEIIFVTVFNPTAAAVPMAGAPEAIPYVEVTMRYGEEWQEAVEKETGKILEETGARYRARRELGHPVDVIVKLAEEEKADLIVMGSRGLGGFQRFFLGSVSDGVLHHAHCPVLIIR